MNDAELIDFARDFREGILHGGDSSMMCFAISSPLASFLTVSGVPCECEEAEGPEMFHCFLRLADGRVLDPTADQFDGMPPVYLGEALAIHGGG